MPGVTFDRAVGFYDATRGLPKGVPEQVRDALRRAVGAGPATRYLEIGVGTGRIALPFVQAGDDYTGADLSLLMMAEFRQKLNGDPGAGRLKLCCADAMALPFRSGVFDMVLLIHLLHLVEDWQLSLRECRRVVRSGGQVVISSREWDERNRRDETAGRALSGPRLVAKQWSAILAELGVQRDERSRGSGLANATIVEYLGELGATVEQVTLAQYDERPRTAREMLRFHRDRIYSSDWHHSDDVHHEAIRRLERWLDEEHPAPDEPVRESGAFVVLIGTMP